MDDSAVRAVHDLTLEAVQPTEINGHTYSATPLHVVRAKEPLPTAIEVWSLTGLVGYLGANRDKLNANEILVHVKSPGIVEVLSGVTGECRQRFKWCTAYGQDLAESANLAERYMPVEEMLVLLNTVCHDDDEAPQTLRAAAVALVGNIAQETEIKQLDDGFAQTVTTRGGVVVVGETEVRNPFLLAPYRTFLEVEQPASDFLLRFRKSRDGGVDVALFEADGGKWRGEAILSVVTYLAGELGDEYEVVG